MRLHAQIGDYDMTNIILDLGSKVNVLTKQTWEQMGKPTLEWDPKENHKERKRTRSCSGYVALLCDFIDKEPFSYEEAAE